MCYSCGYCRVSTAGVGVSEQKDGPFSFFVAVDFVCQWTNDQTQSMKNDMINCEHLKIPVFFVALAIFGA